MTNEFSEGYVTLTIQNGTYSAAFVERAIAHAIESGLTDQRDEKNPDRFEMTVHTPVGPIAAKPIAGKQQFPGFYVDWEVDGEPIALSTAEYQIKEGVFVVHEYADLSEDSPTRSTTYYYDKENVTDAKSILRLLRPES